MSKLKPCLMTAEEAINVLESIAHTESKWPGTEDKLEALDMAISALRAQTANEPLTLEQLRQMDGEPVWIKDGIGAGWFLVGGSDGKTLYFYEKSIQVGEPMPDYGKTWLAYAHEPGGEHDGN